MSDSTEQLQYELLAAQRALEEIRARCERHDAEQTVDHKVLEENRSTLPFMPDAMGSTLKDIGQNYQKWMDALNVVDDPIFLHDKQFRILHCNKAYQQCAGVPLKQIIGQPYYDIFPKTGKPLAGCLRSMKKVATATGEEEIRVGDATYRSRNSTLYDEQGGFLHSVHILEDITGHKLAEEKIREQHELTTQIIEAIPMRIFWKDRDLRYLGSNTLFAKDAGLKHPDELSGKTDFDLAWKDQAEIYRADDQRVMDANTPRLSYDEPQTTPEGEHIWLRTSKVPLHSKSDEIMGMLGVYEDITDYKQLELSLLESEEHFRRAFQNSVIGMALVGLDGRWLKVNNSFCQILGYSDQEMMSKTFQDITHPDDLQSGLDFRARLLAGELDHFQNVKRYFHKDGHVVWIRLSVSLIRDAQNNPVHFISQIDDITNDKLSAAALLKANDELSLFRQLLDNSSDAIEVIDPLTMRYLDVNETACRELGYSREELLSMSIYDIDPAFSPDSKTLLDQQLEKSGVARIEGIHKRKDSSTFEVEVSMSVIKLDKTYALTIVRDITERKKIEAQMVAQYELVKGMNEQLIKTNQQLEQAQNQLLQSEKMAAIGLLAAGVAHEINNPVGYVNSNLATLEKHLAHFYFIMDKYEAAEALMGADNPLFQELRQFKAKINLDRIRKDTKSLIAESHQGLERVKQIILDLKEFSHTDTHDQWEWADIHKGLDSTLNIVWNELKYKCDVVKEYGALPEIYCLPSQLNQVFMDLLVNAAQSINVRGKITLRTGQEGDRIWVEIIDTGKGIPPKDIPRLFEPFFTTKPVGIGTGLGLSISYTIVKKHHGEIEVQSEVGKGSTFRVWLPVQQPDTQETT